MSDNPLTAGAPVRLNPRPSRVTQIEALRGRTAVIVSGPSPFDGLYMVRPDGGDFDSTAPRYMERDELEPL